MTDETPKLKRKRRRWIIAGVLLFAAGVTGLWYWTRGDARFVGKWELISLNGSRLSNDEIELIKGSGRFIRIVNRTELPQRYWWRIEGEEFVQDAESPIWRTWMSLTKGNRSSGVLRYRIVKVDDDELTFDLPGVGIYSFRRIPE